MNDWMRLLRESVEAAPPIDDPAPDDACASRIFPSKNIFHVSVCITYYFVLIKSGSELSKHITHESYQWNSISLAIVAQESHRMFVLLSDFSPSHFKFVLYFSQHTHTHTHTHTHNILRFD
jgi:hypothetical protein